MTISDPEEIEKLRDTILSLFESISENIKNAHQKNEKSGFQDAGFDKDFLGFEIYKPSTI